MKKPIYLGQTERGRMVRELSLLDCVEALAFVANKSFHECVTFYVEAWGVCGEKWYVYEDTAALDRDREANGTVERVNWFAIIVIEEP